jgi:hypothetical protein
MLDDAAEEKQASPGSGNSSYRLGAFFSTSQRSRPVMEGNTEMGSPQSLLPKRRHANTGAGTEVSSWVMPELRDIRRRLNKSQNEI